MASPEALAKRRAGAIDRLRSIAGKLADEYGVAAPVFVQKASNDPDLARIIQMETVAGFLEDLSVIASDLKMRLEEAEQAVKAKDQEIARLTAAALTKAQQGKKPVSGNEVK